MPTPSIDAVETNENFDFHYIYHVVTSRLWLILSCMILWLALGTTYILLAPKIYQGKATLQVDQTQEKVVKMEQVGDEDFKDQDVLKTIEANLTRRSLLVRTLRRPEFKDNPYLKDLVATLDDPDSAEDLEKLSKTITATLRRMTRLIDVTANHPDPATAQALANGLVDEFIQEMVETQSGQSESANQFLIPEAERLQKKLSDTQLQIEQYKGLDEIHQRIKDQQSVIDSLSQRYLDKYPKLIQARALLKDLETQFLTELKEKNPTAVKADPQNEEDFRSLLSDQESQYNVLQQDLASDQSIYESVVQRMKETTVTKGVQEVSVREVEKSPLPIIPVWPKKLITLAVTLVLGLITGLVLAFFFAGLDSSFRRVDDAEEYLNKPVLAAIPLLESGHKPKFSPDEPLLEPEPEILAVEGQPGKSHRKNTVSRGGKKVPLVLLNYPSSIVAESFRNLRASLRLLGKQNERRIFLFTSAIPSEGKSFTCANYAIALAQEGNSVLLIDCDLRAPSLHRVFNAASTSLGVTEYLTGDVPLNTLVRKSRIENLDILFAGNLAPNPAELLSGGGFVQLLEEAGKAYDRIIIDTAPILAVSDTLLIAGLVQTLCLVVRSGRTPRHAVRKAMLLLEKTETKISGVILNCLPKRTGFGYGTYYYYYQSGGRYGEAYGNAN